MEPDSSPPLQDTPEQNPSPSLPEESENWVRGCRSMVMNREARDRFISQVRENASLLLKVTDEWEEYKKVVELKEMTLMKQISELKKKEERVSVVEERERKVGLLEVSISERLGVLEEKEKEINLKEESVKKQTLELKMKEEELVRVVGEREEKVQLLEVSIDERLGVLQEKEKEITLKEDFVKKRTLELKTKEEELMKVIEEREKKLESREVSVIKRLGVLEEKEKELDKERKLNEESVEKKTCELKLKEEELVRVASLRLGVLQEKEKEFDLKQFLEADVMRLVLETRKDEMVTQLNEQERLLQELMTKNQEEVMRERSELQRKTDSALKQIVETDRRREESKLYFKKLEARENELEKFELKHKEEAKQIEANNKILELKEKELDERERKIEEWSVQAETRKRSRLEVGPSVSAEKTRDADSLIPVKRQKLTNEHIYDDEVEPLMSQEKRSSDPAFEQRTEGNEIVCRDGDDVIELDPEPYDCPDPDFNDFRNTPGSFKVGQIWALYDHLDEMPRYYAQIRKILKSQLDVRVTWLESVHNLRKEIQIPIACGIFNYGGTETIDSHLMFSHEMKNITRSGGSITITPRKGETWALFTDWNEAWISDREQHKPPYRYDFVEVLFDFDNEQGTGVAYLGRVEGFTSVYQRAEQHCIKEMMIPSDTMWKFSHRVPSVKLNGDEKEGVPVGSFELDPAAIPRAYLKTTQVKEESLVPSLGWN